MNQVIKYFILLLVFSSFSYGAETIYAWGYGDILGETFKMIKWVFYVDNFSDIWKIVVGISLTLGTIKMLLPNADYWAFPKIFLISSAVWTVFVVTTVDIYVDDKTNPSNNVSITSIPWAVAKPFALFSALNKQLNETYENATSLSLSGPFSSINYSNSGLLSPLNIFRQSSSHKIVDPTLSQNIENYILECVMPDIENGYKDYNSIMRSTNLWTFFGNTNPAIIVPYRNNDGTQTLMTCTTFYTSINSNLSTYVSTTGLEVLAKSIGNISKTSLASAMGTSSNYLLGVSKNATSQLMQNVAINSFDNTFKAYSQINGADPTTTAYYAGKAETTAQSNMIISGILGSKYIPITKGILLVIILGLTPLMVIMMTTPLAMKAVIGYFTILAWLSFWQIGEVLLNHIILTKASNFLTSVGSDYTLEVKAIIDTNVTDYINMASSMYWMLPTIAAFVATGFSFGTFAALSSGMTQKAARGEMAATEAGSGSISQGNISHNNYSANNLSGARMITTGNGLTTSSLSSTLQNGNYSEHGNQSLIGNPMGNNQSNLFGNSNLSAMNDSIGNLNTNSIGKSSGWTGAGNLDNIGGGLSRVKDPSMTLTNSQGESMSLKQGDVLKNNSDGSFSIQQSSGASYTTKDSKGNEISMSQMEFVNGKLTEFTAKDDNGVKIEQEMRGGETVRTFNIGGSKVSMTGDTVTGATIDGVTYSQSDIKAMSNNTTVGETDSEGTSYNKSFTSSNLDTLVKSHADSSSTTEDARKANDTSSTKGAKAGIGLDFSSDNAVWGKVAGFLTGVGVKADANVSYQYNGTDSFSVSTSNGHSQTFSLNESEQKTMQEAYSKALTSSNVVSSSKSESESLSDSTTKQHSLMINELQKSIDNRGDNTSISDVVHDFNLNKLDNTTSLEQGNINTPNNNLSNEVASNLNTNPLNNDFMDKKNQIDNTVGLVHKENGDQPMMSAGQETFNKLSDVNEAFSFKTPGSDGTKEVQNSMRNMQKNLDELSNKLDGDSLSDKFGKK